MTNAVQARRRWWGLLFLTLAILSLVWGLTLFNPWLSRSPVAFVLYWTGCFLASGLAFYHAMRDMAYIRKNYRRQKKDLLRGTLDQLEEEWRDGSPPDSGDRNQPPPTRS